MKTLNKLFNLLSGNGWVDNNEIALPYLLKCDICGKEKPNNQVITNFHDQNKERLRSTCVDCIGKEQQNIE